jgi:RNA polymerase sigma factor (TIGR02999 family)
VNKNLPKYDKDVPELPRCTKTASELLPRVYDELRKLAAIRIARESSPITLEATDLAHEAYVRVSGRKDQVKWDDVAHFFAAAAKAMEQILIEAARRRKLLRRVELTDEPAPVVADHVADEELILLAESIKRLEENDPSEAQLVRLVYFVKLSVAEAGDALGIPRATAYRRLAHARAWLKLALNAGC